MKRSLLQLPLFALIVAGMVMGIVTGLGRLGIPFAPTLATAGVERVVLDLLIILLLGAIALVLPASWTGLEFAEAPDWRRRL